VLVLVVPQLLFSYKGRDHDPQACKNHKTGVIFCIQSSRKKAKDSRSTKNSERSFPVKSKSTKTRAKCPKDLLFVASSSTIGESIPLMISNKSLGLQCSCRRSRILTNIGYGPIEYYLEWNQGSIGVISTSLIVGSMFPRPKRWVDPPRMERKTRRKPLQPESIPITDWALELGYFSSSSKVLMGEAPFGMMILPCRLFL